MQVICHSCGAPLEAPPGAPSLSCRYCGSVNPVVGGRPPGASGWGPPPGGPPGARGWQPAPIPYAPPPPPPSRGGSRAIWLVVLASLGMVCVTSAAAVPLFLVDGDFSRWTQRGLDIEAAPSLGTVDLDSSGVPLMVGQPGGEVDLSDEVGGTCRGWVSRRASVALTTRTARRVVLEVDAPFDSVMLVRTADGAFHCDDDSNGNLDPRLELMLPAGVHRVWVGSFTSEAPGGDFQLGVRPSDVPLPVAEIAPPPPRMLSYEAPPTLGTLAAGPGVPARGRYSGRVVTTVSASLAAPGCRGSLGDAPHLAVQLSSAESLRFVARSTTGRDLVMMVRGPDGAVVCDDDSAGSLQPEIDLQASPGVTQVWVGTYGGEPEPAFELLVGAPTARHGEVGGL